MRISLPAILAFGNAGSVANAGGALSQRALEDECVASLVAALAAREVAGAGPNALPAPVAA